MPNFNMLLFIFYIMYFGIKMIKKVAFDIKYERITHSFVSFYIRAKKLFIESLFANKVGENNQHNYG